MHNSRRVLSDRNGNWNAHVVFVAEAPGRLGAEVTGTPLFGDRTGHRFDEILRAMRWSRSAVFITNVILCNPRDDKGNNDVPNRSEIDNCLGFLRRTLSVIDPPLVVALGRVALNALRTIFPHSCELTANAGHVVKWGERHLGVLYHPGPRTQVHRDWARQLDDARAVADFARIQVGVAASAVQASGLFSGESLRLQVALHSNSRCDWD